jgi:hypothetical protein
MKSNFLKKLIKRWKAYLNLFLVFWCTEKLNIYHKNQHLRLNSQLFKYSSANFFKKLKAKKQTKRTLVSGQSKSDARKRCRNQSITCVAGLDGRGGHEAWNSHVGQNQSTPLSKVSSVSSLTPQQSKNKLSLWWEDGPQFIATTDFHITFRTALSLFKLLHGSGGQSSHCAQELQNQRSLLNYLSHCSKLSFSSHSLL